MIFFKCFKGRLICKKQLLVKVEKRRTFLVKEVLLLFNGFLVFIRAWTIRYRQRRPNR